MLCTVSAVIGVIALPFVTILAVVFERHTHLIWLVPVFLIFILMQKYDYACIESLYLIFKAEHQELERQKFEEVKQAIEATLALDDQLKLPVEQTVIDVPSPSDNQQNLTVPVQKY